MCSTQISLNTSAQQIFSWGGSPCTYWSIAQSTDKRETTASGVGWELFSQYVRALREAQPKFFIYENNKSMARAIYQSISDTFGFEPILINSALVSAQNRQRYYWVGRRDSDGSYSKVEVEQPEDRGILLKDIILGAEAERDKGYAVTHITGNSRDYFKKHHTNIAFEPVATASRGRNPQGEYAQQYEAREDGKANAITTVHKDSMVSEPVCLRQERTAEGKALRKDYEAGNIRHGFNEHRELQPRTDGKSNTVSTVLKDNPICEPVAFSMVGDLTNRRVGTKDKAYCLAANPSSDMSARVIESVRQIGALPQPNGELSTSQGFRIYSTAAKSVTLKGNAGGAGGKTGLYALPVMLVNEATKKGYAEIENGECFDYEQPNSKTRRGRKMTGKANCLTTSCNFYQYFAYAVEFSEDGTPTKAISPSDGKTHNVYTVENGQIEFKGRKYPIKLVDGHYIIRKLTVTECMRLQTVPEWYEFPVSDTQAYKMLGNGWTVEVIVHLLKECKL